MSYADKKSIKLVAIIGQEELKGGTVTLRNMVKGDQQSISIDEMVNVVKSNL